MARQSSESFDEHERPTAPRPRPIITSEQIDRFVKERTVEVAGDDEGRESAETSAPPRERETVDAFTLQRETLIIRAPENPPAATPQIPIDVDLSRLHMPTSRPAAGLPVPIAARWGARLDRRQLTIAAAFVIAMISALLGFIAGRL